VTLRKAAFKRPFKDPPLSRGCLKSLRLEIIPADMACQTRQKFEVVVCKGHRLHMHCGLNHSTIVLFLQIEPLGTHLKRPGSLSGSNKGNFIQSIIQRNITFF